MDNETYISPERAIELGFADHIVDTVKKPYSTVTNKQIHTIMKNHALSNTLNTLRRAIALVSGSKVVNQTYNALSGDTIEIYQQDPTKYQKGDATSVKEGTYELGDGTVVIADYKVSEVIPVGVEPAVEAIVETEVVPETTEAIEIEIEQPEVETTSTETELAEICTALATKVSECMDAIAVLTDRVAALEGGMGAMDMVTKKAVCGLEDLNKFQELATEAISNIANKTSSTWKPEIKTPESAPATGSIFQRLKEARGIK
jgi:hypothetical protein